MTRSRWQYMQVIGVRDPGTRGWPLKVTIMHSTGESEARDAANLLDIINALGAEGWELVGGPETQNAVVPIRTHDGGYNESARWVQRRFWLKRELV